jgi:F420H(2)-dependent quinone reductase
MADGKICEEKMNKRLLQEFMKVNTFLIQKSRGKIGTKLGTQRILLMYTLGRKTGKSYTTPIAFFTVGDSYYVVGSNWGQQQNAAWYYNLMNHPNIMIEVNGKKISVLAREVTGAEYDRLWQNAVNHHHDYLHYKEMTPRHIPIIVFDPIV